MTTGHAFSPRCAELGDVLLHVCSWGSHTNYGTVCGGPADAPSRAPPLTMGRLVHVMFTVSPKADHARVSGLLDNDPC